MDIKLICKLHVAQPIYSTITWSFLWTTFVCKQWLDSFTILDCNIDKTSFTPIVIICCHVHLDNVCGKLTFHIHSTRTSCIALHYLSMCATFFWHYTICSSLILTSHHSSGFAPYFPTRKRRWMNWAFITFFSDDLQRSKWCSWPLSTSHSTQIGVCGKGNAIRKNVYTHTLVFMSL